MAVTWSTTAHWTLGVPFDAITRAKRSGGGQAQKDLETLVEININRLLHIMDVSGIWAVGLGFFLLSVLAALGFWYQVEIGQAIFLLLFPMSLVTILSVRTARRMRAQAYFGEALRSRLTRQRFFNQLIGLLSITVTAFWGMWQNLNTSVL